MLPVVLAVQVISRGVPEGQQQGLNVEAQEVAKNPPYWTPQQECSLR
jgi:hypothetical protein